MAVDFPSSPGVGQTFTSGGTTWIWDGVKWTSTSAATGLYLPLTGGTMTGDLILNRDAVAPLQAATFEQVQARGAGDNRIINGDMRIDQRNNGASGTAGGYTVDRWIYLASQASKGTWSRANVNQAGFPYGLSFISSSAYASLAADYFEFAQAIEADMVSDFQWGTANAQPVTLSFWAYSTLSGTFGGSIQNYAQTRSYPFSYSISTASAWAKITITIPADTGGTWVMSGNAGSMYLMFDLGTGSTHRGPANAWASANYFGATGTVSIVGTNAATFYVTGVKLEIGSVATPYNRQSLAKSMADCQRYYATGTLHAFAYGAAGQVAHTAHNYPVSMRTGPPTSLIIVGTPTYSNASALSLSVENDPLYFFTSLTITAVSPGQAAFTYAASAEL